MLSLFAAEITEFENHLKMSHFPPVYLNFPGKNGLKITPVETIFAKKKDEKMLEILPKIHI